MGRKTAKSTELNNRVVNIVTTKVQGKASS